MTQSQVLVDDPLQRIWLGQAMLEEFLNEREFLAAMLDTQWRMIRTFVEARSAPGKRATPGYIVGLDDQLTSLATFLQRNMGRHAQEKIFSVSDLPRQYRSYTKSVQESIAEYIRFELFMRQLILMRDQHHIWYIGGEWYMPPSVIDKYRLLFRGARESYRNHRNFHGRPNRDRVRLKRLRVAPATSTSAS